MNRSLIDNLTTNYIEKYGTSPELILRSPGRINILGEHTDYNDGFVMPASIDKSIYLAIGRNSKDTSNLFSLDFQDDREIDLKALEAGPSGQWVNYPAGVVNELVRHGHALENFNMAFTSDLPIGSGLSSSAALECGVGYGLSTLFDLKIPRKTLAQYGQNAEHNFVGVRSGILDQIGSIMGKENEVMRLDCRSLDLTYHRVVLGDYELILYNTKVKHEHLTSGYNDRRAECERGVAVLQKNNPEIRALRDATIEQLESVRDQLPEIVYARCKYVIEENARVDEISTALAANDLVEAGKIMYRTHDGLSKEYQVSCPELDFLADAVRNEAAVLGARMMGGGFGGCTLNIVKKSEINRLTEQLSKAYHAEFGLDMEMYPVKITNGTEVVQREM
ncbi:MAG: galactokinase [Bacteroidota bacterium]